MLLQFIEVDPMVVLSSGVTAASRVLSVFANASVPMANVPTQFSRFPRS